MMYVDEDEACRAGIHNWSELLPSGRAYCLRCGAPRMSPSVDWSEREISAGPGPVRASSYEEKLRQQMQLRWHPITTLDAAMVCIIGCYRQIALADGRLEFVWYMRQYDPALPAPLKVFDAPATHWTVNNIGAPALPAG